MTAVHCPKGFRLLGCASERKDFYHQAKVSRLRAHSNLLPFSFPVEEFAGSKALDTLISELKVPFQREKHGDRLGFTPKPRLAPEKVSEEMLPSTAYIRQTILELSTHCQRTQNF